MSDLVERLTDPCFDSKCGRLRSQAADELNRLRAELETERMRLAACGVVAMSNTPESAATQRQMLPEYWCASVEDVARAVDREMAHREEAKRLRAENEHLRKAITGRPSSELYEASVEELRARVAELEAKAAALRAAAIALRDDMLARAEVVDGERVVAAGATAWVNFCDAIDQARES